MESTNHRPLPILARTYISAVVLIALAGIFFAFRGWTPRLSAQLILYVVIALASSGMRVALPGVSGNISVNYVFTLLMLLQFEVAETMALALVAAVVQTLWCARARPKPVHLLFNVACISVTVQAAAFAYHQHWFSSFREADVIRLGIAGGVYFVVNTLSVSTVIALAESRNVVSVWSENYFWAFPYYLVGASLAEMVHVSIGRFGWRFTIALVPLLYLIYRSYKIYFSKIQQDMTHAESMASLHLRTIEALAMAIEAKDECTHDHLRRVQVYCMQIAERLQLPPQDVQALQTASILHDIGKLAVPDHIISKPGKLTPEEFDRMKTHTVVGASILEQVGFPYDVPPIVRSHHERWDGRGYPDGLKGEDIPIGARILTAVDCLDALASDRQYRRALPLDKAMEYVASLSGQQFDPRVIEVLQTNYREFEQLAKEAPRRSHRLDKNLVIERGEAPAAGFQTETPGVVALPSSNSQPVLAAPLAVVRHEVESVFNLAQQLSGRLRLEETLALLVERLRLVIPYDCIGVYVAENGVLQPKYVSGEGSRTLAALQIPVGQGLSGWVVENCKPILNGNPAAEPGYLNNRHVVTSVASAISVPLTGERICGALTLYRTQPDAFSRDELRALLAINGRFAQAIEDSIRLQQTSRDAITDELTGLPNAKALCLSLQEEVVRCGSQGRPLTVVLCDVNGLEDVKDSVGRFRANELLKRTARILQSNCRESDHVGRMDADQFAMLLTGMRADDLQVRLESLDRMVRMAAREVCGEEKVSLTMGVACYPEQGGDADALLIYAENELHRLKRFRKAGTTGNIVQLPRSIVSVA